MVEAAYRHHGLDWRYINCEVSPENLGDAVRGARAMGWAGFNCSIPHKIAVVKFLDGLGKSAEIIGAVNTVVRHGDRFIGENTDGKGFASAITQIINPIDKSLLIFGAGGAARAISVELALAGVTNITVVNRRRESAQTLVNLLNDNTGANACMQLWNRTIDIPQNTDIVINATPIGLYPDTGGCLDLNIASLAPNMVVADVIPNPPKTRLIRDAEKCGCRVLDGLGMLVNQGVIAIKHWTGADVNASVMRRTLQDIFRTTPDQA